MNNSTYEGTIYDYISIAETTFNLLMICYTSYKLGHITCKIGESYCCGKKCCGGILIDIESDSESKSK